MTRTRDCLKYMLYLQSLNWRNMKGKDTGMDDSLCLRELSEGSYEAFDTLYMRYSPIVEQFALSLLKRKEEADDITQNIFLKIWENRSSMSGVHSFRAYLFKMVRNAVYDTFSRRKPTSGLQDSMKLGDILRSEDMEGKISAKDLNMLMDMAVENMPEQRRRVFRMSRRDGLSHKEISMQLGISTKTVEYHMSKALAELRKIISFLILFF